MTYKSSPTTKCKLICSTLPIQEESSKTTPKNIYSTVLATLAVIGGVDKRLRLGGLVKHEEFGLGTVAKIATNGKIFVQAHDGLGGMRQCRIGELEVVSEGIPTSTLILRGI